MYLKNFKEISKNDISLVGGKGASLGEMINSGIPVPPGFVITTEAYKEFNGKEISPDLEKEIFQAFDNLGAERVAVRSSAVAEDSGTASWAGQLESYLNVDREGLLKAIKDCWNSINSGTARQYAEEQKISDEKLLVAVVVQKMVESEASGIMFTINPITKDDSEIMIEAGFGLGEMIVQGMVTPENFTVDKDSLEIKNRTSGNQEMMLVFENGENKEVQVPTEKLSVSPLSDGEVQDLSKLGIRIEGHYGAPQDIEWGLTGGNFYILQSRPITTI